MTAITSIVLNDAASTPVAHTFAPARQGLQGTSQVAEYEDRSANAGYPVGFYRLGLDFSRPSQSRKSYRIKLKLETPSMANISNSTVTGIEPAPEVAYSCIAQVDVVLPERCSLQNRKDLRKMLYEALNDINVKKAFEELDPPI